MVKEVNCSKMDLHDEPLEIEIPNGVQVRPVLAFSDLSMEEKKLIDEIYPFIDLPVGDYTIEIDNSNDLVVTRKNKDGKILSKTKGKEAREILNNIKKHDSNREMSVK